MRKKLSYDEVSSRSACSAFSWELFLCPHSNCCLTLLKSQRFQFLRAAAVRDAYS